MALVAYGSSDESDVTSDDEETVPLKDQPTVLESKNHKNNGLETMDENNEEAELPKPSSKEQELAEIAKREKPSSKPLQLSELVTRDKGKIKISVPRFSDFEEEEDVKKTMKRTPTSSGGRSALFSVLPTPKNSIGIASSTSKPEVSSKVTERKPSAPLVPHSLLKPKVQQKEKEESDDGPVSFFSLDEPEVKSAEPSTVAAASYESFAFQENFASDASYATGSQWVTNAAYNMAASAIDYVPQPQPTEEEEDNLDIDEQALQFLQGKKRKLPQEIEDRLIDIQAEKLSYDPKMSQLKQVSEERASSKDKGPAYNPLQKRKHQITYLAAQAKARELDLKNQWAQNRMSRKQTQAKYGF